MSKITSKESLVFEFQRLNPKLSADQVVLTQAGFRKLVHETWKHAASHGFDKGIEFAKTQASLVNPLYDKIFGRKF